LAAEKLTSSFYPATRHRFRSDVIIPGELNYLLNPAPPAFKRIAIGKPERFAYKGVHP
jgi:hypothetical protein